MSILLIPFLIILFTLLFAEFPRINPSQSIRFAFSSSLILIAILCFVFNEFTSLFNGIGSQNAIIYWFTLFCIASFFVIFKVRSKQKEKSCFNRCIRFLSNLDSAERLTLSFLSVILLVNFLLAFFIPPNNLDSHNYHLNRIINWLYYQNIHHFPTIFSPELYHNAMGEYLVLHTFLLSKSDQFSGFVQYFAMLGNIANVSLIAKNLGLSKKVQILTILFSCTIPIALLESTSTQVDLVACFFFTYFILNFLKYETHSYNTIYLIAALIGFSLGAFTKYTIFLYAFPFFVYVGVKLLLAGKFSKIGQLTLLTIASLAFSFGPFWYRNYMLFGNILSPIKGSRLYLERIPHEAFMLSGFVSTLIKNLLIHAGLPWTFFNNLIDWFVLKIHSLLGINYSDLRFNFNIFYSRFSIQEDMAPNTFHFYFGILAIIYFFSAKKSGLNKLYQILVLGFCGILISSFLLKFELWVSRTQMPFFSLLCILIAAFFVELNPKLRNLLLAAQLLFSLIVTVTNTNKRLIPLKFELKKQLSYIPIELIPDRTNSSFFDSKQIEAWYIKKDGIFELKAKIEDSKTKKAVFKGLIKSHYYDFEKDITVLNKSKAEMYFAPNYYKYHTVEKLFKSEINDIENVGVLFFEAQGYYRYWAYLNYIQRKKTDIRPIWFSKELNQLPNTKKPFLYNYILTDNLAVLKNIINESAFLKVKHSGSLYLVKLKNSQAKDYYLDL